MAEYATCAAELRAAGADVAALAVDPPERSEAVRRTHRLPFPVLCDTERAVVRDWELYDPSEGGIARPATFVIGPGLRVRFASPDGHYQRVRADQVLEFLRGRGSGALRRRWIVPPLGQFFRSLADHLRHRLHSRSAKT